MPLAAYADSVAPGIAVAQAIGRLGNWFNQELFGSATTVPWGLEVFVRTPGGVAGSIPADGVCEFPTDYIKATPELLCGTYQPTFLYEIAWNCGVALVVVLADKRFRLGGGRAFALYVAGYTLGRTWIEMLRIDPANHIFGLRINVFTSVIVFLGAVLFLILRRNRGREDPAVVWGPDRPGKSQAAREPATVPASTDAAAEPAAEPTMPIGRPARRPRRPADRTTNSGRNRARSVTQPSCVADRMVMEPCHPHSHPKGVSSGTFGEPNAGRNQQVRCGNFGSCWAIVVPEFGDL